MGILDLMRYRSFALWPAYEENGPRTTAECMLEDGGRAEGGRMA